MNAVNLPSLSVVVPNYNHGRYLRACVEAIVGQSAPPLELILIDDGSTDGSVEVAEQIAREHPVVRFARNEKNMGVVFTMNRGLEMARGHYVFFASADDRVKAGLFEKSLRLLAQHPGAGLCCAIGDWREEATGLHWHAGVGMSVGPAFFSPGDLVELERRNTLVITSHTALMKREALVEAGGFIPELRWHCDWFTTYVAAFRHGMCHLPEPLGEFIIHSSSYYKSGSARARMHEEVLRRMLDLLGSERYRDVAPTIREAGSLFLFGWPMVKLLLGEARYRPFLTARFLRKATGRIFQLQAKRLLPAAVGNWYLAHFGFKAPASTPPVK